LDISHYYFFATVSCLSFTGKEHEDVNDLSALFLRELLYRLNDEDKGVLLATHNALFSLTKNVPAEELVKSLEFSRNLIASIVSEARRRKGGVGDGEFLLPGFNMPKGEIDTIDQSCCSF
jgi:hypothetical protein